MLAMPFNGRPRFERDRSRRAGCGWGCTGNGGYLGVGVKTFICDGIPARVGTLIDKPLSVKLTLRIVRFRIERRIVTGRTYIPTPSLRFHGVPAVSYA